MIRQDKNYDIWCQMQLEANKDNSIKVYQMYQIMPYAEILFDTFDMQGFSDAPDGWIQFGNVNTHNKQVISAIANSQYCDKAIDWISSFVNYASKNVKEQKVVGDWTNIKIYNKALKSMIEETEKLRKEDEASI